MMIKNKIREIVQENLTKQRLMDEFVDTVDFILQTQAFIFFPEMSKNTAFITTLIKLIDPLDCSVTIVVENSSLNKKKIAYGGLNVINSQNYVSHTQNCDILIFDNLQSLKVLSKCDQVRAKIVFGITNSALLFYKMFLSKTEYKCYTHINENGKSGCMYNQIITNSTIVTYKDTEKFFASNADHPIINFYKKLRGKKRELFNKYIGNEILTPSILKEHFKSDLNYVSEKIGTLQAILKYTKEKRVIIIVKNIFSKITLRAFFSANNENKDSNNIFLSTYVELEDLDFDPQVAIFFDFYPYNFSVPKFIICNENAKKELERLIAIEEAIETEIIPTIAMHKLLDATENTGKENKSVLASQIDEKHKVVVHKFTVYFDSDKQLLEAKNKKISAIDVTNSSHNNHLVLNLETVNPLATSFQLCEIYQHPVSYRSSNKAMYSFTTFEILRLGQVNFYDSFIPVKKYEGTGFAFFQTKISLFILSKKANIRVEIDPRNLESQCFAYIQESNLLIYLALKSAQKVYNLKHIDLQKYDDITKTKMERKYKILDELNWQRVTADEFNLFGEYFDFCLSINLDQSHTNNDRVEITEYLSTRVLNQFIQKNNQREMIDKIRLICKHAHSIQSIFNKFTYYNTSIRISNIVDNKKTGLTLQDIRIEFANSDFEKQYHLEILLSKKGNYLNHTLNDFSIFKKCAIQDLAIYCDALFKKRFAPLEPVIQRCESLNMASKSFSLGNEYVKQIILTPLRVLCQPPEFYRSNRVLRNFDSSNFIRVYFREEDNKLTKIYDRLDMENVLQRIKHVMRTGIQVGSKRFFFLAMSSSQLKSHSAWFISPHIFSNRMIGADFVRSWMGNFKAIHNIGKYAARLGQALSATTSTLMIENIKVESDIVRNGYTFSDGVGIISSDLAYKVARFLNVSYVPAALQIRIGGFKGVVSVFWNESELKSVNHTNKQTKLTYPDQNNICRRQIEPNTLILRESMKKFDSDHKVLEVVSYSQYTGCKLNRQIIILLEALGINKNVFLEMQDKTITDEILYGGFLDSVLHKSAYSNIFSGESHILKMEEASAKKHFTDLANKSRIFTCKGRILMGVLDEYNVLRENEVFIKVSPCTNCSCGSNTVEIILGMTIVCKNPCLHPGDVRIATAVDNELLHHYVDVIVFSSRGKRPMTNMCSGSDLDGDCYFCIWDERLIPEKCHKPDSYQSANALYKEIVSVDDIMNFYIRFMKGNHLGYIANAHLAFADKLSNGVLEPECIRLASLFNLGVDFTKTGYVAHLPNDLTPTVFPDFMELLPSYKSQKVLGFLYRRSLLLSSICFPNCECIKNTEQHVERKYEFLCTNKYNLHNISSRIMRLQKNIENLEQKSINGSLIYLSNLIANLQPFLSEAKEIYKRYKLEQKSVLQRHNNINEHQAILGGYEYDENKHSLFLGIKNLNKKYKKMLYQTTHRTHLYMKALAWYVLANENCAKPCTTFGWLSIGILNENIEEFDKFRESCEWLINTTNTERKGNIGPILQALKNDNTIVEKFKLSNNFYCISKNNPLVFNQKYAKNLYIFEGCTFAYTQLYFRLSAQIKVNSVMKELFAILHALRFPSNSSIDPLLDFLVLISSFEMENYGSRLFILFLVELSKYYTDIDAYVRQIGSFIRNNVSRPNNSHNIEWPKNNAYQIYKSIYADKREENGNKLLAAAYIINGKHTLGRKIIACENLCFESKKSSMTQPKNEAIPAKNYKLFSLVVKGMFDSSERIYFEKYTNSTVSMHNSYIKYIPGLLNPGKSTFQIYKDDFRIFLANNIWNGQKNNIRVKIRIQPGKLYFYNAPDSYVTNNFELEALIADINSLSFDKNNIDNTFNHYFLNDLMFISNSSDHNIYVRNRITEELQFFVVLNNTRYRAFYSIQQKKITMITKNRSPNCSFTFVDKQDIQFVAFREELIYCQDTRVDLVSVSESVLLSLQPFKDKKNNLRLAYCDTNLSQLKLHFVTNTEYVKRNRTNSSNIISVLKRTIYDYDFNEKRFCHVREINSCEAIAIQNFNFLDFQSFDDFFEETWSLFTEHFGE